MKKILVCISLLMAFATMNAQKLVKFNLKPDGTFQTIEGKAFIVVEYEGKTAQELYDMVKSNVFTLYNSPQHVLNEIEPTNITIRALSDVLYSTYKLGSAFVEYRAKYNLVFHFKDGRIRIDAPLIDRQLNVSATAAAMPKTFKSLVGCWFEKDGSVKKKKQDKVSKIETILNYPINYLLGSLSRKTSEVEEGW